MQSEILNALQVSAMGMRAQGTRVRVITENVANANTTGETPGADPYRRQTISFKNQLERESGLRMVEVNQIGTDQIADFTQKYEPDHPAADDAGYVKYPNVNTLLEMADIREAQRSYEANLGMIEQARTMAMRTIDLLRV